MWFFNKKKKLLKEEEVVEKLELTNEQKVIKVLNDVIKESVIKNDVLWIEDINLTIEAHVPQVNDRFIQVVFVLNNDKFDEPFVESVAGVGKNIDEQIQQAVASFSFSALCGITSALRDEEGIDIETLFYDKTNKFKLYKSCKSFQGEKIGGESVDFLDMLGDEIKKRIGNKKVYWIKIYAAKTNDSVSCECRINGIVNSCITKIINEFAEKWKVKNTIYAEKQFFVLIQDESTYVPYKFSKDQVNGFVDKALKVFGECDNNEKYSKLLETICYITLDIGLGVELEAFIPEILCEVIYNKVTFMDQFTLHQGNKETLMFCNQLISYNWIYENISKKVNNNHFSQKQIQNIIRCSASFKSIHAAIIKGSKIENLVVGSMIYNFSEKYRPY